MTNKFDTILICGSGSSLPFLNSRYNSNGFKHGLEPKLEQIIKSNFSIGINYFQKYGCETTLTTFCDWQFYIDNYKWIKTLPFLVGKKDCSLVNNNRSLIHDNTILLPIINKYNKEKFWDEGLYYQQITGTFSISLAIALGFKRIFLLGMDCTEVNGQTHFYQDVVDLNKSTKVYFKNKLKDIRLHYRGVGKKKDGKYNTSTYNYPEKLNTDWFLPFSQDKDIEIFNVSLDSKITIFPKLTYEEFYSKIGTDKIFQDQARAYIRNIIWGNKK